MTIKLGVLSTQPDDADAFDNPYLGVHAPLVEKVPGLQRWESARIVAAPDGGEQTYFRMAELYFGDPGCAGGWARLGPGGTRLCRLPADCAGRFEDVRRGGRRLREMPPGIRSTASAPRKIRDRNCA